MRFFKTKAERLKIDSTQQQILDLVTRRKELEISLEQQQLELNNTKRKSEMALEEERHRHKLVQQEQTAQFEREKKIWQEERARLLAQAEEDKKQFEARLKSEYELKSNESMTLHRLEAQQQTKQAEIDRDRKIEEIRAEFNKKMAEETDRLRKETYERLSTELAKLHSEGNNATKFMQETVLAALNGMSKPMADMNVNHTRFDINQPKQIEAKQ